MKSSFLQNDVTNIKVFTQFQKGFYVSACLDYRGAARSSKCLEGKAVGGHRSANPDAFSNEWIGRRRDWELYTVSV
ncbi:hypothetical protein [Paenisporosarcina sp. TG20]|uniref:hypothetical protein n=1 Tax=Paenisporosarcina sp. TG20 TaxID=1211706 RepID=UPI0012F6C7BF|nr:hypothetical protein [Paenisporosarcina sp. TG20]